MTHAFLDQMGGYTITVDGVSSSPGHSVFRLAPLEAFRLFKLGLLELPSEKEIVDKSKADWVTKSITLIQVTWYLGQLIARAAKRLPVTTLELFTSAIIVCTTITYRAWWNKPLDIQRPLHLDCTLSRDLLRKHKIQRYENFSQIPSAKLPEGVNNIEVVQLLLYIFLAAGRFAACHLIGWNFDFPTYVEQILWRIGSVACAVLPAVIAIYTFSAEER